MQKVAFGLFSFLLLIQVSLFSQNTKSPIVSGPMLGYVEHRSALVWVEVNPELSANVQLSYWQKGSKESAATIYPALIDMALADNSPYMPLKFELYNLKMNTDYEYQILIDEVPMTFPYPLVFKTKDLWEWRKPAPDFSFLFGSCLYNNDLEYDRPGTPYGRNFHIFDVINNIPNSSFMIWLGDNTYLREADYSSPYGIYYRYSHDRSEHYLQRFLASQPHYATWDDHDYGPNNSNKNWGLKDVSRRTFIKYWGNHYFGEDGKGIYFNFKYGDCEFFLLDGRSFRDDDNLPDSINGQPNPNKKMIGEKQMEWLKNSLMGSTAVFKVIVSGSQVINPVAGTDCWRHFPKEYQEFMDFLKESKLKGILFFSGDKHESEMIKVERPGTYPLYDITSSSITAGESHVWGAEVNNPYRVGKNVETQNITKVTVEGPKANRTMTFEFVTHEGKVAGKYSISEKELK